MKDERFFWGDLHPVCVLRGLLYNLWVLILAVLTAWLCVEGYHLFTYHPVYTASATVAVNVKGGTSAYTSLDLTARMAQVFAKCDFKAIRSAMLRSATLWLPFCRRRTSSMCR